MWDIHHGHFLDLQYTKQISQYKAHRIIPRYKFRAVIVT